MLGARPRPQILRIELDTNDPIAKGMPKESIAWVENSPVFEVLTAGSAGILPALSAKGEPADKMSALPAVHVIAWYPKDKDPLLSGWLLGGDRIKGKAALVEVGMGKGRIILFGFRPQYRGQSLATYPLFLVFGQSREDRSKPQSAPSHFDVSRSV